jgi:hypothetical protein
MNRIDSPSARSESRYSSVGFNANLAQVIVRSEQKFLVLIKKSKTNSQKDRIAMKVRTN